MTAASGPPAASRRVDRVVVVGAEVEGRAAVGHERQPLDVVGGLAGIQRVAAARVVADHPAERAPGVGRGVRAERQAVLLGRAAQVVEDDARLDAGGARHRVQLEDPGHVPAGVDDDRDVAGLAGEARPRAAGEGRRVELGAHAQRGHHVVVVEREDDPERHLAIVRRVGRVHRARRAIERDLAAERGTERLRQVEPTRVDDRRAIDPAPGLDQRHGAAMNRWRCDPSPPIPSSTTSPARR